MAQDNSIETLNLDEQQFRLNKINETIAEIKERELMSKTLSKYIAFFIILISLL